MTVMIANAIDFVAAFLQVGSGSIKSRTKVLIVQSIQLMLQAMSMLILGGVPGAISNVLSCFRNYLCCKDKLSFAWKCTISAVLAVMTVLVNEQGAWGYLPVVVSTVYIFFMDIKDPARFKLLIALSYVPWLFYRLVLKAYVGAAVDAATIITNTVTFFYMIQGKPAEEKSASGGGDQ